MVIIVALITLLLCGCGSTTQAPHKKIDRAQRRTLAWQYGRLMTSATHRSIADKAAHNVPHARSQAIDLAKQTKMVQGEVELYEAVGLSPRATRRYKAMLAHTKQRVASAALTPQQHTRTP